MRQLGILLAITCLLTACQSDGPPRTAQAASTASTVGTGLFSLGGTAMSTAGDAVLSETKYPVDVLIDGLQKQNIDAYVTGDTLLVVLPVNRVFYPGGTEIRLDRYRLLGTVAKLLSMFGTEAIYVDGHSNDINTFEHQMQRSALQARAVGAFMSTHGVAVQRLKYVGFGATSGFAENTTASGRSDNSVVTITTQRRPLRLGWLRGVFHQEW